MMDIKEHIGVFITGMFIRGRGGRSHVTGCGKPQWVEPQNQCFKFKSCPYA